MLKNRSIPFGYCMANGKYALNAPEAEAVRKIFADYIGGKSLKTIAAEMQIPYNTGKADRRFAQLPRCQNEAQTNHMAVRDRQEHSCK